MASGYHTGQHGSRDEVDRVREHEGHRGRLRVGNWARVSFGQEKTKNDRILDGE